MPFIIERSLHFIPTIVQYQDEGRGLCFAAEDGIDQRGVSSGRDQAITANGVDVG
jgi:hypothetical protein